MIFKYEDDPIKLAVVLFYDKSGFADDTANLLADKILRIFVKNFGQQIKENPKSMKFKKFDKILVEVYEDTLKEWLGKFWIDLYSRGAILTWFHVQFIN